MDEYTVRAAVRADVRGWVSVPSGCIAQINVDSAIEDAVVAGLRAVGTFDTQPSATSGRDYEPPTPPARSETLVRVLLVLDTLRALAASADDVDASGAYGIAAIMLEKALETP